MTHVKTISYRGRGFHTNNGKGNANHYSILGLYRNKTQQASAKN